MKAVLVINMPSNCKSCMFCGFGGIYNELNICMITGSNGTEEKLDRCPLRPLPCKLEELEGSLGQRYQSLKAFNRGWNACLDEITGETE